ncbi:MAG: glycosyltransferase family 4 protein [Gammaproteobacteria bacterium]|nr:glycosyltransferase family 4 protein [Gammaproteobacteria bacterium]
MGEGLVVQFHIHHRRTGVTTSIENILPELSKYYTVVWHGSNLNTNFQNLNFYELIRLIRSFNKNKTKIIVHVHRNIELIKALLMKVFFCKFTLVATRHSSTRASWLTRFLYGLADYVIALNKLASDNLSLENTIIPHGLDIEKFPVVNMLPSSLGIISKYTIGIVGRIRSLKGQKDLVDAVLPILQMNPDWDVIILGQAKAQDSDYIADIKSNIIRNKLDDRFHFVGEVEDPRPYYNIFDIVVVASYTEGSSMVPLEAMATDSAVIATENVGTNSLIVEDGINGYLYPVGDINKLTERISILMQDPIKLSSVKKNARKSIEEKWTVEQEVVCLKRVYDMAYRNK